MTSFMGFLRPCAVPAVVAMSLVAAAPAQADAEAESAIRTWLQAIMSGDSGRLAGVLAPEFQIQRSDGKGFVKAEYAGGAAAKISGIQDIADLVATRQGDLLVARYNLAVAETINGRKVERKAPRLTVFRRDGARWLVVAHANFARIE